MRNERVFDIRKGRAEDGNPAPVAVRRIGARRVASGAALAMTLAALLPGAAAMAQTADEEGGGGATGPEIEISGEATLVSDYRFRGVSLSDRDFAVQGALDFSFDGWHLGWWGSSIQEFAGAEAEIDLTLGRSFSAGGLDFDVGGIAYLYPGGEDTAYLEGYGAVSGAVGPLGWEARVHYVPRQPNTGRRDNVYLAGALSLPLGTLDVAGGVPVSFDGGLGYEDGAFADGKWDWRLGLTAEVAGLAVGIHYVDTSIAGRLTGATALFTISKGF